jgi:hypothetical protein
MTNNTTEYSDAAQISKDNLNKISPTMCMAKWLQVSMYLPQGLTHSCYHPPVHKIPLDELNGNPKALHNTLEKIEERKKMWNGERPSGCQYCWNIEDAPGGPHLSDRHYRSSEAWVGEDGWKEVVEHGWDNNINPRYVEVNFNQACNFKCVYCSPHLSTAWEKEIEEFGPMKINYTMYHNDLDSLRSANLMPLHTSNKENPYVESFWEWWPDLYPTLKVFRMTGGEPLMDKNTFKVLDYVNQYPNATLDLSITTNACPPDQKLFDKFVEKLKALEVVRVWEDKEKFNPDSGNNWYVAPACKHFSLFVSLDSIDEQAEYIRTGLEYNRLVNNVKHFLTETHGTEVTFINTFNLLSIPKLKDFLQLILDLRVEFGYENQNDHVIQPPDNNGIVHSPFIRKKRQRVWFDIPYLRHPDWMSAQLAAFDPELLDTLNECLQFMEDNVENENYGRTYHGFKKYEIAKLKRNIAWISNGKNDINDEELVARQRHFWRYFMTIDKRRDLNFIETFPELTNWWINCYRAIQNEKK